MSSLITLTTDFGQTDPAPAIMKGVMYSVRRDLVVIDITHQIPPQDVKQAAYCISRFKNYFPEDTVHVAVVDPGVGSNRDAIILKTERYYYVGPNNGVFSLVDSPVQMAVKIKNQDYMRQPVSVTFHGRDVFAPVAAHLTKVDMDEFGPEIGELQSLDLPEPVIDSAGNIYGEITSFDHFGNAFTNISGDSLRRDYHEHHTAHLEVVVGEHRVAGLSHYYQARKKGELGVIINSFDCLELYTPNGSAEKIFGLAIGDPVTVHFK